MISGAARDQIRIDLSITAEDSPYSKLRELRVTGRMLRVRAILLAAVNYRCVASMIQVAQAELPCSADQND
jgi:hypothetical protein